MILNSLPISAYSGLLKFDMKMFVNIARLDKRQLCTQSTRWGHPCTLDTFLVFKSCFVLLRENGLFDMLYFTGGDRD